MGGQISSSSKLGDNEQLRRFVGLESITDNDPFWNALLSFNWKLPEKTSSDNASIECQLCDASESLLHNSPTTGNFAALVRVFLRRAHELRQSVQCHDAIFLWQTGNALLILRFACKFLLQRLSEPEFIKMFSSNVLNKEGTMKSTDSCEDHFENSAEELLNTLIEICVDLPVNDSSLAVHLEAMRTLIVLLSAQLYQPKPDSGSAMLQYFMHSRCSIHAPLLAKHCLRNYVEHTQSAAASPGAFDGGSVVLGIATSMWGALSRSAGLSVSDDAAAEAELLCAADDSLGNCSLLLLVCLCCYSQPANKHNPYRDAIAHFLNSQEKSSLAAKSMVSTFRLDYSGLYSQLCASARHPPALLLLYLLLHSNTGYRNYVLSRVNIEELVVPVLRVLHSGGGPQAEGQSSESHSHHVYLALVLLLILSEDEFYCKLVHETSLTNITWYSDELTLHDCTLGGLVVLVLVRTVQINIVKMRDRYLHTNSLAALSNMSGHFKQLSPLVCQKLIGLLELLSRRHAKLVARMHMGAELDTEHTSKQLNALQQDLCAFEEGIRTLLELLNRCLSHELRHNVHLLHTMLYKKQVFAAFDKHPVFHDLIANINNVLQYFSARVQSQSTVSSSVTDILGVIHKAALQWPTDRLKKFPDMTFRYVEDDNTEEFFVPYVWQLIYEHSMFSWPSKQIRLFAAHNNSNSSSNGATETPPDVSSSPAAKLRTLNIDDAQLL